MSIDPDDEDDELCDAIIFLTNDSAVDVQVEAKSLDRKGEDVSQGCKYHAAHHTSWYFIYSMSSSVSFSRT